MSVEFLFGIGGNLSFSSRGFLVSPGCFVLSSLIYRRLIIIVMSAWGHNPHLILIFSASPFFVFQLRNDQVAFMELTGDSLLCRVIKLVDPGKPEQQPVLPEK